MKEVMGAWVGLAVVVVYMWGSLASVNAFYCGYTSSDGSQYNLTSLFNVTFIVGTTQVSICNAFTASCGPTPNSVACKTGSQSWGTLPGATWMDNRAPITRQTLDPSVGVFLVCGPGEYTCGGYAPYTTGIAFQCDYSTMFTVLSGTFDGACDVDYAIATQAACPCQNFRYGSQYGGDCTCASQAPFGYWKSVCSQATWNLQPFGSSLPSVFIFNGTVNDLVSDQVFINGSYIQSSGSTLAMSVLLSSDGSFGGSAMVVTGCVTLAGVLEVTFMGGSTFVPNARIPLLRFGCRTGNSQFSQVRVLNAPSASGGSYLFVYSSNSLDLVLQGATPITFTSIAPTANTTTATSSSVTNNSTNSGGAPLSVVFVENTPQVELIAGDNQAGQAMNNFTNDGTQQELGLKFVSIGECTSSNVSSGQWVEQNETKVWFPQSTSDYGISLSSLILSAEQVQEITFTTTLSNNATVWIKYLLASGGGAFDAPFADSLVSVGNHALKFSIGLANWPNSSSDPQHTRLCLQLGLTTNPPANAFHLDSNDGNQTVYSLFQKSNNTNQTLNQPPENKQAEITLLDFAAVSWSSDLNCINGNVTGCSVSKEEVEFEWDQDVKGLAIVLPLLQPGASLYYDPNVALFLTGESGDGSGDGTTTLLLSILIPVCGGLALLAFAIAVIVGILLGIKKRRDRRRWLEDKLETAVTL